jgi:hypothetical protein
VKDTCFDVSEAIGMFGNGLNTLGPSVATGIEDNNGALAQEEDNGATSPSIYYCWAGVWRNCQADDRYPGLS